METSGSISFFHVIQTTSPSWQNLWEAATVKHTIQTHGWAQMVYPPKDHLSSAHLQVTGMKKQVAITKQGGICKLWFYMLTREFIVNFIILNASQVYFLQTTVCQRGWKGREKSANSKFNSIWLVLSVGSYPLVSLSHSVPSSHSCSSFSTLLTLLNSVFLTVPKMVQLNRPNNRFPF